MTRQTITLSFLVLAGCVGDPSLEGADTGLAASLPEVERERWEPAEPGCEDVILTDVTLYACEGEPLLGALVDDSGEVRCVDAMSVLLDDLRGTLDTDSLADDPSPQPSHPGGAPYRPVSSSNTEAPVLVGSTRADGSRADPTPTPVVWADPTPTPVTEPDPTPTPIVCPHRD